MTRPVGAKSSPHPGRARTGQRTRSCVPGATCLGLPRASTAVAGPRHSDPHTGRRYADARVETLRLLPQTMLRLALQASVAPQGRQRPARGALRLSLPRPVMPSSMHPAVFRCRDIHQQKGATTASPTDMPHQPRPVPARCGSQKRQGPDMPGLARRGSGQWHHHQSLRM